jgi:hypothetical protein
LDALNFLPAVGYGASRLRRIDDVRPSGINNSDSFDELQMKGQPVSPLDKTYEHALNPEKYLNDIAEKYNINLRSSGQDIKIQFDPDIPAGITGITKKADGGKIIRIGREALVSEENAANTIAHELSHARDYLRGDIHKTHGNNSSLADGTVYGSGNALQDYIQGNR